MIRDCFLLLMDMRRTQAPRSMEHCLELCSDYTDSPDDPDSCAELEACLALYRRHHKVKRS